jgi:Arm DNA-binding domain
LKHKALKSNVVASLVTPGRYIDGAGLTLVVRSATSRQWVLRTMVNGRRMDIGLGSVATVSLAKARELAESMRSIARNGEDPPAQRRAAANAIPTFAEATHSVHTPYSQGWKNPKHSGQWINTLTHYVFPQIGKLPINMITTADVLRVLTPIWLAKPETARRVRGRIETIFRWARAQGVFTGEASKRSRLLVLLMAVNWLAWVFWAVVTGLSKSQTERTFTYRHRDPRQIWTKQPSPDRFPNETRSCDGRYPRSAFRQQPALAPRRRHTAEIRGYCWW